MLHNRSYTRSPPPMVSPNDPTANDCKVVEYRGEKIAAFMIDKMYYTLCGQDYSGVRWSV